MGGAYGVVLVHHAVRVISAHHALQAEHHALVIMPVSYTHLDVYKRQSPNRAEVMAAVSLMLRVLVSPIAVIKPPTSRPTLVAGVLSYLSLIHI